MFLQPKQNTKHPWIETHKTLVASVKKGKWSLRGLTAPIHPGASQERATPNSTPNKNNKNNKNRLSSLSLNTSTSSLGLSPARSRPSSTTSTPIKQSTSQNPSSPPEPLSIPSSPTSSEPSPSLPPGPPYSTFLPPQGNPTARHVAKYPHPAEDKLPAISAAWKNLALGHERAGDYLYAAYAGLAGAVTASAQGDSAGEAALLLDSGRKLLSEALKDSLCPADALAASRVDGISAYYSAHAVHLREGRPVLAAAVMAELGAVLRHLDHSIEAAAALAAGAAALSPFSQDGEFSSSMSRANGGKAPQGEGLIWSWMPPPPNDGTILGEHCGWVDVGWVELMLAGIDACAMDGAYDAAVSAARLLQAGTIPVLAQQESNDVYSELNRPSSLSSIDRSTVFKAALAKSMSMEVLARLTQRGFQDAQRALDRLLSVLQYSAEASQGPMWGAFLQSLAYASEAHDLAAIHLVEEEMAPLCTTVQRHLVSVIVSGVDAQYE